MDVRALWVGDLRETHSVTVCGVRRTDRYGDEVPPMTWVPPFVSVVLVVSMFTTVYQTLVISRLRKRMDHYRDAYIHADIVACAVLTRTPCDGCGHVLREGQNATVRVTPTGVVVAHPLCVPPWGANPEN